MVGAQGTTARGGLDSYADIVGIDAIRTLREKAAHLRGLRVLHLSASASRTYHDRTLGAVIGLLSAMGLQVRRLVPEANPRDQAFADAFDDAIEGDDRGRLDNLNASWPAYAQRVAAHLGSRPDVVIVHDPRLLPVKHQLTSQRQAAARWVWHCHVDLRDCAPALLQLLSEQLQDYASVVTESSDWVVGGVRAARLLPPVIDPLAARNVKLGPGAVDSALRRFGIRSERPMVLQVSTFDGWDDPQWAICTYDLARRRVPGLQLVLAATGGEDGADDDPFANVEQSVHADPNVILIRHADDIEVNALQGAARVAMQQRVRKGFTPALLEASWKGRPVLAGDSGSIAEQVVHGRTGFVFGSFEAAAEEIATLTVDPVLADSMGLAGHRFVRENHLTIRWIEEYLDLMSSLSGTAG